MKNILRNLLLLASVAAASCTGRPDPAGEKERPNILFILSDDHAYQAISAYGNRQISTPNIDRIAEEGAIFTNQFVVNSICGPSRAVLLTGKYSHKNGFKSNSERFDVNQPVFPDYLRESGYETAWIGKWHLGTLPGKGFSYWNILPGQGHYYNPDFISSAGDTSRYEGYVTNIITDLATDFLDARDPGKPFFLVVGEKATHRVWMPDIRDLGAYDDIDFPLPETFYDDYEGRLAAGDQDMTIDRTMRLKEDLKIHLDETDPNYTRFTPDQEKAFLDYYEGKISREFDEKGYTGKALTEWKYQRYMKDYLATARSLDRNIGKLLEYLEKHDLAENTVVIYASDQGFYLGEHGWFDKRFIYEESLRTPFLVRYPGKISPGTRIDDFVLNIDYAPTLLEIAGLPVPADIQGTSFLPLLQGRKDENGREAAYYHYYEYPRPHRVSPHFGIRTKRYKLARFYGGVESWELFDLEKDPRELKNVYSDPAYAGTVKILREKLRELIIRYDDQEALREIGG